MTDLRISHCLPLKSISSFTLTLCFFIIFEWAAQSGIWWPDVCNSEQLYGLYRLFVWHSSKLSILFESLSNQFWENPLKDMIDLSTIWIIYCRATEENVAPNQTIHCQTSYPGITNLCDHIHHILCSLIHCDGLAEDCSICNALALEILQSFARLSISNASPTRTHPF